MLKLWKNGNVNEIKQPYVESENVEERVLKWLREEGYNAEKANDGNSSFRYWVTKTGSPKFSVFQPRNKPDFILVESAVTFAGHDEIFPKITDQTEILSWELQSHLLSKGFHYKIQPPEFQPNRPGAIFFAKPIYYDGLSKDRFLEATHQTLNTVVFMILTVRRHLATSGANPNSKRSSISYLA
jgi:hypothetical protein